MNGSLKKKHDEAAPAKEPVTHFVSAGCGYKVRESKTRGAWDYYEEKGKTAHAE